MPDSYYTLSRDKIYKILVDKKNFVLKLLKNNIVIKTYPIAIGKPATPTPTGKYKIINKAYKPGGPFGERWLGLSIPGYGIHGTNNPSSIGKAVSNGCIRTFNENIIELYNTVPLGTTVEIF
ncbi:L,D-transpeptidase [Clostridium sp. 19966]|uniref:L,D-transpeptidase n=1 Tax=Clostridium sp. 19966 TaxID=2768166 RepID=UPI0028DF678C|nr:L,D-transpeptidase [Clostridium sp. 19966]MDT8716302.1 L,D-transpeptidase [Clostridium sp. 19966]